MDTQAAGEWLEEHKIKYVELIVPDMAGMPKGKVQPADSFLGKKFKIPITVLSQTVTGKYFLRDENIGDRDMEIRADLSSLRIVPWANVPTASVIMDCYELDGTPLEHSPRLVLKRIIEKYQANGWNPVVAPEVEFYLTKSHHDKKSDYRVFTPETENLEALVDPYGLDKVHDLEALFDKLAEYLEAQNIFNGAVSQEIGPAQFEINFDHGDPLKLADEVFLFKRTLKRVATEFGVGATFLAKPDAKQAGSALHIHQSVNDMDGNNLFATEGFQYSEVFEHYMGGLQQVMPSMLLLFAPYDNSYRRFLSHFASPINFSWGIDNRSVGFRVPESVVNSIRIENRIAGSDVNPYLAIAGSIACGYLGMTKKLKPAPEVKGSAYDAKFGLHRDLQYAIQGFKQSEDVRALLGDDFVEAYCALKDVESLEFQRRIPEWERDFLLEIL